MHYSGFIPIFHGKLKHTFFQCNKVEIGLVYLRKTTLTLNVCYMIGMKKREDEKILSHFTKLTHLKIDVYFNPKEVNNAHNFIEVVLSPCRFPTVSLPPVHKSTLGF